MTKRFARGAAALVAGLLAASCATFEPNPEVVGTYSDKLSPYNFKEEGALVRMVVGVEAARFIRDEPYFPVFLQVVNKSKATLRVTRESFTLEDPLGRQYALTPMREITEHYNRIDLDRRLYRQNRQFTASGVSVFTYITSQFYPSSARAALVVDHVTLPPTTYMEDVLYFPIPESGLNGVPLRLVFKEQSLGEPIAAVFQVPRTLGIMEKNRESEGHPAPDVPEEAPREP